MLILIAESKTMAPCAAAVSLEEQRLHQPILGQEADQIIDSLRGWKPSELADTVKLSLPMVRKLQAMIYEFPNKALGGKAIEAFTGVVFKAFSYSTLAGAEKKFADSHIRIISSLYGWLRPGDIVKPYRFDFTTPIASGGKPLATYWRDAVTDCLIEDLKKRDEHEILNLLPGDAARCLDWNRVESHAKIWKADFREVQPGGEIRTPNAGQLKKLRGQLLRQIVTEHITLLEQLTGIEGENYVGDDAPDASGSLTFHTAR